MFVFLWGSRSLREIVRRWQKRAPWRRGRVAARARSTRQRLGGKSSVKPVSSKSVPQAGLAPVAPNGCPAVARYQRAATTDTAT